MTDEEHKKIFATNLNRYLEITGRTQKEVADAIEVSPQTFNTWCMEIAIPRMGKIQRLADYFGIDKADLIEQYVPSTKKGRVINVYGRVAAGVPIEMINDVIDTEEIPERLARTGEFFGLRIKGDSMEPKISNGDTVIVRKQEFADSGDIVIVSINGTDATCKRLKKYHDGIELISTNPSYEPQFYTDQEVIEKPIRIIGKVIELRAKF